MSTISPEQEVLLEFCAPPAGVVVVNERACIRTERIRRAMLVHGVIVVHYGISDRASEEYAMFALFGAGYADQDEIARAFGYSTRSIRRYEQRFESGGLRTTLIASVLLALLRIPRPEILKENSPGDLGRIVGLDRITEVKTLLPKLARLDAMKRSRELGLEMARLRIAGRGHTPAFLCVDGHIRAYHGKGTIAKAYLTGTRIARPATTDNWINDQKGDPLFVVTTEANAAMSRMLVPILPEVRNLLGKKRRLTVVFDRGVSNLKLFKSIPDVRFDILTYRKGRFQHIAEKRFVLRKARLEGRRMEYLLHDQAARFSKGKPRLRQVTRLTETA